jgi:hypothetical protein
VPDQRFESAWQSLGCEVHEKLDAGKRILIHCRGGLGRTGLVAGLILVERGYEPTTAIQVIRAARPHAIETRAQERYVLNVERLHSAATPIVADQRTGWSVARGVQETNGVCRADPKSSEALISR